VAPIITEVQKAESWLKAHERILIIAIIALSSVFIGSKLLDGIADRDHAAASQASQVLQQQQNLNQTLAAQVAVAQKQNQDLIVQLTQQNAALQMQQSQRTVVLTQQVATDKTMPLPDLGNRWAQLAQLNPGDITATTAGITVTPQGALQTTTMLEQLPVAQSNLVDVTKQRDNLTTELTSEITLSAQKDSEIVGLNIAAVDASKACIAQIKSVKATANKSKAKWFKLGFVTGFVSGLFIGHAVPAMP
jgi:protein-tyrosine-phosphatase